MQPHSQHFQVVCLGLSLVRRQRHLAQLALQLSAQSVCLTSLRAQNSPVVNVDRNGWLRATPKNTPKAKLHTRASPNPAEPLPCRRPPAPVGLDPLEPKQLAKSFGNLELIETVLDIIRRHPQLLSLPKPKLRKRGGRGH